MWCCVLPSVLAYVLLPHTVPVVVQDFEISEPAKQARDTLHDEMERRFVIEERDGHLEDLYITTLLDPRCA